MQLSPPGSARPPAVQIARRQWCAVAAHVLALIRVDICPGCSSASQSDESGHEIDRFIVTKGRRTLSHSVLSGRGCPAADARRRQHRHDVRSQDGTRRADMLNSQRPLRKDGSDPDGLTLE